MNHCYVSRMLCLCIVFLAGCQSFVKDIDYSSNDSVEGFYNPNIKGVKQFKRPNGQVLVINSDDLFELGDCSFTSKALPYLSSALYFINKQSEKSTVDVRAFTDNVASDAAQLELTRSQAESVASYLWAHGLDIDRLTVSGVKPSTVVGNKTMSPKQLAMLRRVEITVSPQGGRQ